MTLANDIAQVKSRTLRDSLVAAAPVSLPGALAILTGTLMQPLTGVKPILDGLSAPVAGQTLSLHQRGSEVSLRQDGVLFAVARTLAELEDSFFDALFAMHAQSAKALPLAA